MGDLETGTSVSEESTLGYHPFIVGHLTDGREPAYGQCQAGSLTGAVSSQKVTEDCEGSLRPDGNRSSRIWLKGSLTVRPTSRADAKAGQSDQAVENGIAVA